MFDYYESVGQERDITQYGHEKSNESVKNMDGTFAGWSGMV